jgi:DNA processing protein
MDDRADWLTLHRAPAVGARLFQRLLERFGSPSNALQAQPELLRAMGAKDATLNWLSNPDQALIEADLAWLSSPQNHILRIHSEEYPSLLYQLSDPPPLIFACGNPNLLHLPQLAIVGTRNPSTSGTNTARHFAHHLAENGIVITSGLALGIDTAAHTGALEGKGKTIAVLGTGVDRIYPAANRTLAHRIVEQGGILISEFPLGSPPLASNFPRRNRILSGLSLGVLVVEAAIKSGSLITARLANEQGKEVFAIPGSIHNSQTKGCHHLIKNGAKLVETTFDIVEELTPALALLKQEAEPNTEVNENTPSKLEQTYQDLLTAMGFDPISIDQLVQISPFNVAELSSMLLLLELEGHVSSIPGGLYCRVIQ